MKRGQWNLNFDGVDELTDSDQEHIANLIKEGYTSGEILQEEEHDLIIISLFDAEAECSCGNWHYCFTGSRTKEEINEEFQKHLEWYN